jgi:hypothetical protein
MSQKCRQHGCEKESTFFSPDYLCDEHWAEWWAKGLDRDNWRKEKKNAIKELKSGLAEEFRRPV